METSILTNTKTVTSNIWIRWSILGWLAQVFLVITLPEMADEAYYTQWGNLLASGYLGGYLDHPPSVAWWALGGGRLLNVTLLPIAWYLFASAARKLGATLHPLMLIAVAWWTPLGLSSGVIFTPDSPLLLGWSIAVWGYAHQRVCVSALGIVLGAWSKAMIWPAAVGLGWLWLTDQRVTTSIRLLHCLLWTLMSLTLYFPHIYWSWNHNGYPWSFQSGRQWGKFSTLEWLMGQILVGGLCWSLGLARSYLNQIKSFRSSPHSDHEQTRIWWWLSAPSAMVWLILSLVVRVEANWSALAWPMGLVWVIESNSKSEILRFFRWGIICTLPCLMLPLIHQFIPIGWGPPRDGRTLATCLEKSIEQDEKLVVTSWIVGRYQEAALLQLPFNHQERDQLTYQSTQLKKPLRYLRAWDRRLSHYDFEQTPKALNQTMTHVSCGEVYLGPPTWVGPRCVGKLKPLKTPTLKCALKATLCVCE